MKMTIFSGGQCPLVTVSTPNSLTERAYCSGSFGKSPLSLSETLIMPASSTSASESSPGPVEVNLLVPVTINHTILTRVVPTKLAKLPIPLAVE
jgi:hypothetical protein